MQNEEQKSPKSDSALRPTDAKSAMAGREEAVLKLWQEKDILNKTLKQTEGKEEFVFFEGPPTANGKPGIHHIEARSFKDAIPRYKTMRGYHVRRKGGWDTHGLPVELQVEKELGLKSKKEIEEYGVEKFNQKCRESVWQYRDIWEKFTHRIGYWIDTKNPYVTYHNSYIESVWNILAETEKKNLLYKDYKVLPWCPRCGTALSSHELAQGYQDDKDLSVTAKFKIVGVENGYFLAWTTTPWTLPGNVALAVGNDIDYVEIKVKDEILVLAKERLSQITDPYEIVAEHKGSEMVGMQYEPLFPYMKDKFESKDPESFKRAYKVYAADFVTTTDGTGIVHTAIMYGQEDFVLGTKVGLPKFHLVDESGYFLDGMGVFSGLPVKDVTDNGLKTAIEILRALQDNGNFFSKETITHTYPHCWRCKTPLIYYARDSWYIRMSEPRGKLIKENEGINWEPEHIKDGRFGEWLREVKDWAVSRERYWGTPLPIWEKKDGTRIVVDSIETLKKYTKKTGNKYFVMRHGGTEGNDKGIVSFKNQATDNLTEDGKKQVQKTADLLVKEKIDLIICSPFVRTRETADIIAKKLGLTNEQVIFENNLHEINGGDFDGKTWEEYHQYILKIGEGWFEHKIPNGESLKDVGARTGKVLYELEEKYKNKKILIITHGGPAWALFVNAGLFGPDGKNYQPADSHAFVPEFKRFANAEVRALPFVPLPHNQNYELDLHKPFIDNVELVDEKGEPMKRVKEVLDVWFDSGAMPFAQDHYPFENDRKVFQPEKGLFKRQKGFPADFICEAIDQTRGWFYTLHAVGALMGVGKAYKNVICLGHILDKDGKKMSKSVGNVIDPWEMIEKYGADTLRLWMYSVNQPGDSKNFDEKTVLDLQRKFFGLLYNVLAFYDLYRDRSLEPITYNLKTTNVLDQWILARLSKLISEMTVSMDKFQLLAPVRNMRDFIDDLSTWYLRRSRDRLKDGDADAKKTLYLVLKTLAKLMAPFAPFSAEDMWQKLKTETDGESVHLESWPHSAKSSAGQAKIIEEMKIVRDICTSGNAERKRLNIPLRQPLQSISIFGNNLEDKYFEIIKDELNIKDIFLKPESQKQEASVVLDIDITPELKREGDYRELVRAVQDMRKKAGLEPSDSIDVAISLSAKQLLDEFMDDFKKVAGVKAVSFADTNGEEVKVGEQVFKIKIEKK